MATIGDERRYNGYCEFYDSYHCICELANRYPSQDEIASYCHNGGHEAACWDCYYYRNLPHPKDEPESKAKEEFRVTPPEPVPEELPIPDLDDLFGEDTIHPRFSRSQSKGSAARLVSTVITLGILALAGVLLVKVVGPMLIRPKFTAVFAPEDSCPIPLEQVELCLVSRESGEEEYRRSFDEDGTCTLQVKAGAYDVYCAYGGVQFHYFTREFSLFSNYEQQLPLTNMFFPHGVLIRLWDGEEQMVLPEIKVSDQEGTYVLNPLPDGSYCLNTPNLAPDYTFTIYAEGFQPVQVSADLRDKVLSMLDLNVKRG